MDGHHHLWKSTERVLNISAIQRKRKSDPGCTVIFSLTLKILIRRGPWQLKVAILALICGLVHASQLVS